MKEFFAVLAIVLIVAGGVVSCNDQLSRSSECRAAGGVYLSRDAVCIDVKTIDLSKQ
ncbi:MAG: hypothetical protein ACK4OE_09095 [Acidovorax sp.]|uniref:hypothetical protein n=1 Tax=Acidovorax sp. TaxID=1872122 RepID=UPI00391C1E7A